MRTAHFRVLAIVLVAASAVLSGCASGDFERNVYEGVRNRNEALNSAPPDYSRPRAPAYDEYERERRRLAN